MFFNFRVKNSSSEDDEGGTSGEERQQRPNKLFPVRSEQDELFRKVSETSF